MTGLLPNDIEKKITVNTSATVFEETYINVRKREQRIYSNDEVARLPDIYPGHIHYKEWQARKSSSGRLIDYLHKKERQLKILEIGCGNGWLCSRIASIDDCTVTGLDINLTELTQAFAVHNKPNLSFIYGDLYETLRGCSFDIIVFAASVQYFPSLKQIISHCLSLLNPRGEIHILDTFFYEETEIKKASERTEQYYSELGFPEMASHYFHHSLSELNHFNYKIMYKGSVIHKLFRNHNPFPWIQIINK